VISWAERKGAEGDDSCWKVSRHPYPIYRRFACMGVSLECDWWEEGGRGQ